MSQNYIFFVEGKILTLVKNERYRHTVLAEIDSSERHLHLFDLQHELKQLVSALQNNRVQTISLFFNNVESLLEKVMKCFKKHIIAAGGVVENDAGDILFIYRNGFWDLPKGKLESDEDIANTAVREVMEETGMVNIVLGKELKTTFHTYREGKIFVLKETRWYAMKSNDTNLTPQTEEGITELKWVPKKELPEYLDKSYPNIKVLMCDY